MPSPDQVRPFILSRIERRARLPAGVELAGFDYISSGHVDSIGIVQFVLQIESEFDVEISDADMTSCAFRTVDGVIALVERKLA